jgi:hypothetical protein
MQYFHLLVSSLALSFCSCSESFDDSRKESKSSSETINISEKASFNWLPVDMLRYLNNFLENQDQFYLKNVSRFTRNSLSLKKQVEQTFNISGLENFDDNEPELAGVMRLAWIKHDPLISFAALMEEVVDEKRPYKVILRPLVLHLARTFRSFNLQELIYAKIYDQKRNNLAAICVKHGHFDLLFELLKDEHFEIVCLFLASSDNRDNFFEFLRNNFEYVDQFLNPLIIQENKSLSDSVVVWIAGCIIKNLPQSYYEKKFITFNQVLSGWMIDILFLSTNVPEWEYSRIHAQIVKLFQIYSNEIVNNPNYATFLRIINDIRFGSFDLIDFQAVDIDLIREEYRILSLKSLINSLNSFQN